MNEYFKLYASCILSKGVSESLILDTERGEALTINNLILEVLQTNHSKGFSIEELKGHYNQEYNKGIDTYFDFFVEKDLGFYTNAPNEFLDIDLNWDSPSLIQNAVIEMDRTSNYNLGDILEELNFLGCEGIQLRILDCYSLKKLAKNLLHLKFSRVKGVELFIKYQKGLSKNEIVKLLSDFPRLISVVVHSAPFRGSFKQNEWSKIKRVFFIEEAIATDTKEIISPNLFGVNLKIVSEAMNFNLGLNRKVSINSEGEIKNYLSHEKTFGRVQSDKIRDVINKPAFQEKWHVHNDMIEKCKSCQYRYICINNCDIKMKNGKYYRDIDCGFDPYINKWSTDF